MRSRRHEQPRRWHDRAADAAPDHAATDHADPDAPRDTQAPSAPGGLSVTGQTQTALTLSWNASTDNVGVTGYNLYRGGKAAGSNNASTRSYTFNGLSCGTTYTVAVDAVDAAGNRSTQSSASGTTSACPAPPQPGGLVAAYSFNGGSGATLADSSGRAECRHDLGTELDDGRQERRRPHLRRRQRPRHGGRLRLTRPDHRDDARGVGAPDREHVLADDRDEGADE